jgi:acetyl esterase/lipase
MSAELEDRSVLNRPARPADRVATYGTAGQIAEIRDGGVRAAERPLVIVIHGGFWRPSYDRAHARPMAEAVAAAGWTVALIEYARIPGRPDITLNDVSTALRRTPSLALPHDSRVVLIGHSAGGHLALWGAAAGVNEAISAVIALAPVADLQLAQDLNLDEGAVVSFIGRGASTRPDIDPRRMRAPTADTTIIHGTEDSIVPLAVAESYVAAHPTVRLVRCNGAGHFSLIDPLSAAWPVVLEALQRVSRRTP